MASIYEGLRDKLVALATVIAGESEAEDVVQDVFLEVLERPREIHDPEKYFIKAVTSRSVDVCRRSGRMSNISDIDGLVA